MLENLTELVAAAQKEVDEVVSSRQQLSDQTEALDAAQKQVDAARRKSDEAQQALAKETDDAVSSLQAIIVAVQEEISKLNKPGT